MATKIILYALYSYGMLKHSEDWQERDINKASGNEKSVSLIKNMKTNAMLFTVWKIKLSKKST